MKKKKRKTKKQQMQTKVMQREIAALTLFLLTLITFLGEFGLTMVLGDILVLCVNYFFGLFRYPLYFLLFYAAYRNGQGISILQQKGKVFGVVFIIIASVVLLSIPAYAKVQNLTEVIGAFHQQYSARALNTWGDGGGLVGIVFYGGLSQLTGLIGTMSIAAMMLVIGFACALEKTIWELISPPIDFLKTSTAEMRAARLERKQNKVEDAEEYYDDEQYGHDAQASPAVEVERPQKLQPRLADTIALNTMFYDADDMDALVQEAGADALTDEISTESMTMNTDTVRFPSKPYQLPQLHLLNLPEPLTVDKNTNDPQKQAQVLAETLANFKIKASVSSVKVGPAITQYEVSLAPGVKVNRIVNLATDIALALAVKDVRIEAPIPGKSAVGIEVPNTSVQMVGLYEVLRKGHQDKARKLLVGLGRTINGDEVQIEINKMPHLLVAGATGSGKSVCVNAIILSILLRATPDEVKFLMIDPKKVELNVYNDIPHLLAPVVTNPKAAAGALRKVVSMMEERYEIFADAFVRNLEGYNAYARKNGKSELPYVVVIIDELSDLMVVAAKEVEESIMRLAQMARAAGIHLIVATQRPSVDVITGVIKSNIPSRIAFAVSSQVDSRTILDSSGAEKLVGRGDMLYLSAGENKPIRVQGAYISEEEIEKIVDFVKKQQASNYDEQLVAVASATPEAGSDSLFGDDTDELFDEALAFAITIKMISTSKLQRRFHIGFNRAARIIDSMVEAGVLGPVEGNKGRRVLIQDVSELAAMVAQEPEQSLES